MKTFEYSLTIEPYFKNMADCGDTGMVIGNKNHCFAAMVDVLGHGAEAREVAIMAEDYLYHNFDSELDRVMNGLHEHLLGSRGAAVSLCTLDISNGTLLHTSIGNITARIIGHQSLRLISKEGIVGYGIIHPILRSYKLVPGDMIFLHTDGVTEHFEELDCIPFIRGTVQKISDQIVTRFGKKNDDASCMVIRYLTD